MPPEIPSPELRFQQHIADFLIREHEFAKLEQDEIDPDWHWAEDHLWAFLRATQAETVRNLEADYGTDARDEVLRALKDELKRSPLWFILRHGLTVRGRNFHLYYPKPRSANAAEQSQYGQNRITFRPHFYFGETNQEIDFVLFLNGLPIVALELKHEAGSQGWNVHTAVEQFASRDHRFRIFQIPFLYLAADTTQVKVATDPRKEGNFRWFNTGLENTPTTPGEYPVEFLYREVLSRESLLEALAFFLVHVPEREARDDRPFRPAYTLFPRYHQGRMVRKVADKALEHFAATGNIGRKFLINHSAGSGKTLSICWLADRLHSLFKPGSNDKLVDLVVVLTDRKSLDKNIRDEIENFTHLKDVVGIAENSDDLRRYLRERKSIIVSTQQKFAWLLDEIQNDPGLKDRRVAFLIDEAHRSQEGQMGAAIRLPFRMVVMSDAQLPEETPDGGDATEPADDTEDQKIAKIIREHDHNQLFVAFTATPAQATVDLFGEPFDVYSESEAIAEGYIVDVASSIISYKTLYNLHCHLAQPEKLYPPGIVAKALKNVAFADDGLIQYKAEVMLRIFDEQVKPLIGGRAKVMIVATSRVAGLRYFEILKEKLKERGADYKVLFAFSDFVHPQTNESISEHRINELGEGELIEDRFEGDDYRLMVVANKFQTGFDQPLLAGMFLDKAVVDRNAVQTVSRLNRCHEGKNSVVVVDFTNNAKAILRAFARYRPGTPYEPEEPDEQECVKLLTEILQTGIFTHADADDLAKLSAAGNDADIQARVALLRTRLEGALPDLEQRKAYVYLLARFVKSYYFLVSFFSYPAELQVFVRFAELIGPQLIKAGSISELMKQIRATEVTRASVQDLGVTTMGESMQKPRPGGGSGSPPVKKVSVSEMIEKLREQFAISEEEALIIKEVTEEKTADEGIKSTVLSNSGNSIFLAGPFKEQVNGSIQGAYSDRKRYEELSDPRYTDAGAIFDIMAVTVIHHHLGAGALH